MIRLLIYLAAIAAVALGVAWMADRPGEVVLTWQGMRIETSLMVALSALVAAFVVLSIVWTIIRAILDGPESLTAFLRGRRRLRGRRAVARGLVAVGVGDVRLARRAAAEARRYAGQDPLALLLRAQAAQLASDRALAAEAFRAMLDQPETQALGYRGLFVEAQRRGDMAEARLLAEEAMRQTPDVPWAGPALLDMQTRDGDWEAALATVERNRAAGAATRQDAKRQRAVILTGRAYDLAEVQPETARAAVMEAVTLAPDLVPAAALAGRFLAEGGDMRKASRVLEAAWKATPHPDLAEVYLHVRQGDAALDRLKRARTLADKARGDPEGALVLAQAAIQAREFARARQALQPLVEQAPSRRACLLMAELEAAETGDSGRARGWIARAVSARRDPAWVADGVVSDVWQPISPVSGRLDAFVWTVPQESLAAPASPVLEAEAIRADEIPPPVEAIAPPADIPEQPEPEPEPAPEAELEPPAPPPGTVAAPAEAADMPPAPPPAGAAEAVGPPPKPHTPGNGHRRPHPVEVVIPMPPLPDDPGLEPEEDQDRRSPARP